MQKTNKLAERVAALLGLDGGYTVTSIQSLWGGYGDLCRIHFDNAKPASVIVKHIQLPQPSRHPRGWNSSLSHQRKLRSYDVELTWYREYAQQCQSALPRCLYAEHRGQEVLLILEDLSTKGFPQTNPPVSATVIHTVLTWLAHFHAQYMHHLISELWSTGTYWHLATRPDELAALADSPLKSAAKQIDTVLSEAPFQTLVHGDAKLANFCFTEDLCSVAAVDFQYVGTGCGMKDVCLFFSSVFTFTETELEIEGYLNHYFSALRLALAHYHPDINGAAVEEAWRPLYFIAWADFQRFVKGWCPDHWKINAYTESVTRRALDMLAIDGKCG
ncbi:phosphotransferase [Thaumasiovibrio sp. DFM-14]|uniref:phosphotransferase n=1 Tax=Thaumasiovibrio sp. DFM-14 TaxID=3384792 RepID=UPI00399FDE04